MTVRSTPLPSTTRVVAAPPVDAVPRWCVQRFPDEGADCITLKAFDGEGYPIAMVRCKIKGSVEMYERALWIDVETAKRSADASSCPPLLTGRRLSLVRP